MLVGISIHGNLISRTFGTETRARVFYDVLVFSQHPSWMVVSPVNN